MAQSDPGNVNLPVLTLKNLYRLLTRQDYPRHSYRVFPPSCLRGETLLKFWYRLLRNAFPQDLDLSMFDSSEKRNRNVTRLINRTGSARLMDDWFGMLSRQLDPKSFRNMISSWTNLLEQWHYNPSALSERLLLYMGEEAFRQELENPEELSWLLKLKEGLQQNGLRGADGSACPPLFMHGLALSWLTLYALYGNRAEDAALRRLRFSCDQPFATLYRRFLQNSWGETSDVEIVSARQCVLCVQPLPDQTYFGNRDLLETAIGLLDGTSKGKLLVRGIGGTGKTEFVRQLLSRLVARHVYQRLAFVQYEGTLEESFRAAFPKMKNVPADRLIREVRALLEDQCGGSALLLIDNLNSVPAQDPSLRDLAEYGCDIIVTSRCDGFDGFSRIPLFGLDEDSGQKLFMHYYRGGQEPEEIRKICAFVAWHPLAIRLLASLCRSRFWSPEKLRAWLEEKGLADLSYIYQASPVALEEVFTESFRISQLPPEQQKLISLMAMLPYRYLLPKELLPYAGDVCQDEMLLTDHCRILGDLGWLLARNDEGFALHPLIAEITRLRPVSLEDFPLLLAGLRETSGGTDDLANQTLVSVIRKARKLNLEAIRILAILEQNIINIPYLSLPENLYELHRLFLEEQKHALSDDADYWLSLGIRDLIVYSRRDRLEDYLQKIRQLPGGLRCVRDPEKLFGLLEYVSSWIPPERSGLYFREILPEDPESVRQAEYLISLSVKQRRGDQDPEAALASLDEADRILARQGLTDCAKKANLDYRRAIVLLDLGKAREAKPLIENTLRIMRKNNPDNSVNMISTRNTYAVVLMFLQENAAALVEYEALADIYRRQHRTGSDEYLIMRNNTALLLDRMGNPDRAKAVILEVLALEKEMVVVPDIAATHQRNAAMILAHHGEYSEAEPYAREALALRSGHFREDSPWIADARAILALTRWGTGHQKEAEAMISGACEMLRNSWGSTHRHTLNAEDIRARIFGSSAGNHRAPAAAASTLQIMITKPGETVFSPGM